MRDVVVYDAAWAESITARIKQSGEAFGALLLEAHEGAAWKFRGYKSWAAYVDAEFGFTRQHSYKLIGQEQKNQRLAAAGSATRLTVSEAAKVSHDATVPEIERAAVGWRSGPIPKPAGKRRSGGLPGLDNRIVLWRADREKLAEDLEADDATDYLAADVRQRFEREAQRQYEFWESVVTRLSQPRRPVRMDESA